ncbi:hypothetical protein BDD43_5114 [Mucilaginibacter gracilis]|uniref:Uncharacterized protein n=1 Tax=Mucilaginibacter gracilis TaxID=423350 RepID=A0A495J7Y9_9SPHI|nr:hypothetical protein [Mucilaginibacter gracilis]RKR84861.1 hypothetical protein BDD43_5114 [Mucilaginibacter gracilis]
MIDISVYKLYSGVFKLNDKIYLAIFGGLIIARGCLRVFDASNEIKADFDICISMLGLLLFTQKFLMKFTNLWFSICWFLLTIVFGLIGGETLSFYNLFLFFLYHIIRFLFITVYKKEFVPPVTYRSSYEIVSDEWAGRSTEDEDIKYKRILLIAAIVVLWLSAKYSSGY